MYRIKDAFHDKKAFIVYLMAGDPNLAVSAEYILAAQEAGADMIEIGIPFSDPIAEGEVIQAAAIRALASGARLDGVFEMVESIKSRIRIPIVFMTYLNPVFVYGYEKFFARCEQIGICGVIIPDLPYEEQGEVKASAAAFGVEVVTLIAPTSGSRVAKIARGAEGFIYLVSSMGVTGEREKITSDFDIISIISDIKKATDVPIAVGFGVSTREQASYYTKIADGVIVGSAIVRIIGTGGATAHKTITEFITTIKP